MTIKNSRHYLFGGCLSFPLFGFVIQFVLNTIGFSLLYANFYVDPFSRKVTCNLTKNS